MLTANCRTIVNYMTKTYVKCKQDTKPYNSGTLAHMRQTISQFNIIAIEEVSPVIINALASCSNVRSE